MTGRGCEAGASDPIQSLFCVESSTGTSNNSCPIPAVSHCFGGEENNPQKLRSPADKIPDSEASILRGEHLGGDYGVFVRVHVSGHNSPNLVPAVKAVLESWLPLWGTILVSEGGLRMGRRTLVDATLVESPVSLQGRTLVATAGQSFVAYSLPEPGVIDFLFHHLVVDGPVLMDILNDLNSALEGRPVAGAPWPWGPCEESEIARPPETSSATYPPPGMLASVTVEPDLWRAVCDSCARAKVSPFAAVLEASAAAFPGQRMRVAVDSRLVCETSERAGNRIRLVEMNPPSEYSLQGFGESLRHAIGAAALPDTDETDFALSSLDAAGVVVSYAEIPSTQRWANFEALALGPYVDKFRCHVQVQFSSEGVWLEVRSDQAAQKLAAVLDALGQIGHNRLVEPVLPVQGTTAPSVLDAILVADAQTPVRDLGLDSIALWDLANEARERWGVTLPVAEFLSWRNAGDVQTALSLLQAMGPGPAVASPVVEVGVKELPLASDIFIDAFRSPSPGLYDIGLEINLTGDADLTALVAAVNEVVAAHDVLHSRLDFVQGHVMVVDGAPPVWVPPGEKALSLRQPQRLVAAALDPDHGKLTITLHHVIADLYAVQILLGELDAAYHGRPLSPVPLAEISSALRQRNANARAAWAKWDGRDTQPLRRSAEPGRGAYEKVRVDYAPSTSLSSQNQLVRMAAGAADFFGRPGTVGVTMHGRTVPGADHLIASMVRVLPLRSSPDVAAADFAHCWSHQDITLGELGRMGIPSPAVVIQVVRTGLDHPSFARDVTFAPGQAKFELSADLCVDKGCLEVFGVVDHYSTTDLETFADMMLARLEEGKK